MAMGGNPLFDITRDDPSSTSNTYTGEFSITFDRYRDPDPPEPPDPVEFELEFHAGLQKREKWSKQHLDSFWAWYFDESTITG